MKPSLPAHLIVASVLLALTSTADASEDFSVRYNLAGSLGGEMFASPDLAGLSVGMALTRVDIRKVTGDDGQGLTRVSEADQVALPAPTPAALYPSYESSRVAIHAKGVLEQWNLGVGYISHARYGGGRFALGFSVPYASRRQSFEAHGATPALRWNANVPAPTQAAVNAQFDTTYQRTLAGMAAAESGEVAGFGDAELHLGWRRADAQWRLWSGVSLVMPTGRYSAASGPDIGSGNFYTVRPATQLVYLPRPNVAVAGRVTVGLNSTNRDNKVRSGNWASLEAALGYMTRWGPIGAHVVHAQQFQDDRHNIWGTNRFRATNAGVFFTTRIPVADVVLTLQYMNTLASRNAKHGSYAQLRVGKTF